jgi:hypothetical protein
MKEVTMNTPDVNTQNKPSTVHQELGKFKEEQEMKTATLTAKVNIWLHEHLALKTPIKLLVGLALGALVMAATALPLGTTYADEPARPLTSEGIQCYPEDNVVCLYDPFLAEVLPNPALATDTTVSGVQFEEWPEAGFDSYTYHRFMVEQGKVGSRLSKEQLELIREYDTLGMDWRIDDYGRVVVFEVPRKPFAGSSVSIDVNEVWSEIEDTPVFHLMKQLKAGTSASINGITCYPELDIC